MSYPGDTGPRTVGYQLASSTYEYLMRAIDLGLFEGPLGNMKPNPSVQPILDALNQVLAGGEVKIEVVRRGSPDILNELNRRLADAAAESNSINQKAGYYVTAA
jgi:hypothetical protein